jgi:hypothetical protein
MVTPLTQMTVGEALSSIRDIALICGMVIAGWKARSWIQPFLDTVKKANKFFDAGEKHMQIVESGMQMLLNNHLHHIESDLGHISGRQVRVSEIASVADSTGNSDSIET